MTDVQRIKSMILDAMRSTNEPSNIVIPAMASLLQDYGVSANAAYRIAAAAFFEANS